ncbi:MAG: hypothetical protein ACOC7N_04175 [Chloroflexota bacterium]
MVISPYWLLVGLGVGVLIVFVLRRLGLFVRLALALAKVAGIVVLIILAGWAVGLWRLPRPLAQLVAGIPEPWEPVQRSVVSWFQSLWR